MTRMQDFTPQTFTPDPQPYDHRFEVDRVPSRASVLSRAYMYII